MLDNSHRRVNPARESTGSDLYTVLRYNPITQTADLAPASTNQRGALSEVPVCVGFGGAWEIQSNHEPKVSTVNVDLWGDCPRGPRWGTNYPIQPGDMVRVEYQGEMMSDPVVTGFFRWRDGYGVPWVANQVLGKRDNDYSKQLPQDDAGTDNRYDLLLPTGAWLRSGAGGSWAIATPPVHFPMAWVSVAADGKVKIKGRGASESEYTAHLELDPAAGEARLALGSLDDSAHIELKDGNITLRAKKRIQFYAERFDVDLAPQSAQVEEAIAPLLELQAGTSDVNLLNGASEAAANLITSGHDPIQAAANVFNSPIIEEATRNRIQDLVLEDSPVAKVMSQFEEGMEPGAIAQNLLNLVGAQALQGSLTDITQKFDLGALSEQLNVPSWVMDAAESELKDLPIDSILGDITGNDREALTEISRHLGSLVMDGASPESALNSLFGEIGDSPLMDQLFKLPGLPLASADTGDLGAIAARLGSQILQGNDVLKGAADLFGGFDFDALDLGDTGALISKMANTLERQFVQGAIPGMDLIGQLPDLEKLIDIPREIRDIIPSMGDLIPKLPDIASGLFDNGGDVVGRLLEQFEAMPQELLAKVQDLPEQLLSGLDGLPIDSLQGLMADPQAALDSLFSGLPGIGDFLKIGILRVESIRDTDLAHPFPDLARSLPEWAEAAKDLTTEATPIRRYLEYAQLNLPDYFADS